MPIEKISRFLRLCIIVMLFIMPVSAFSMENDDCQGCHGDEDSIGTEFYIDSNVYNATAHAESGCLSCHESVSDEHPDDGLTVSKADCRDCHEEIVEEYEACSHANSANCGDCHNPHTVSGFSDVSCRDMDKKCAVCHDAKEMEKVHNEWLPQTKLHLAMIPCISCHTDTKSHLVVWYIVKKDNAAKYADLEFVKYDELQKLAKGKSVQSLIDLNGDNSISLAEMKSFNSNPDYNESVQLHGMLSSESSSHSLTTFDNRWDCSYCHSSGPEHLQASVVALPTEIETYRRIDVEEGAASKLLNVSPDFYMNVSPDFYIIGATRSMLLNIIGLLLICCGLAMPVGHGSLRFLTRKNRIKKKD